MWSETIFSKGFFFICKVQGQKYLWQKWMGAYLQNAYVCVRSMLWGMSLLNNICWGAQVCFAVSLCSDGNSLVIAMTTKTSRQPSNISDDRRCVGEYQPLPACQFIIPLHFPPKQSSLHIKVARDIKCGRLISAAQACGAGKPLMFLGVWFAVRLTKPVQGDVYCGRGLCGGEVVNLFLFPLLERKGWSVKSSCFSDSDLFHVGSTTLAPLPPRCLLKEEDVYRHNIFGFTHTPYLFSHMALNI